MQQGTFCLLLAACIAWLSPNVSAEEKTFSQENRDKKYEFFGRDGRIYDNTVAFGVQTIPSNYGRLISVLPSPANPRGRELWFESNDGTIRRVVLVPVKNRPAPFMIYREIVQLERD